MGSVTFNVSECTTNGCVLKQNGNVVNGNATVDVGDTVQWNKTGSTLTSISIAVNLGDDSNIWGNTPPAPYPNTNSANWRGTVQSVGDGGENYTVSCTCDSNSSSHDPRITVSSGGNR